MTGKMSREDLVNALRDLSLEFALVKGCYLLVKCYENPDKGAVEKAMHFFNGDLRRTEEALNGFYMVSDFLDEIEHHAYSATDLLYVAREYKNLLDEKLKDRFPGIAFDLEILGANLVYEEPLELCVTFKKQAEPG